MANRLKNTKADLVLAIPRGGVVVGAEVAKQLKLPLDILVVRKIGAPMQEELALGAVDPDGETVWEKSLLHEVGAGKAALASTIRQEWKELKRREDTYRAGLPVLDIDHKTVILVDDGIATGATTLAAINFLKRHQAKIILAVPVASKDALEKIAGKLGNKGKIVVLEVPPHFQAVGQFYAGFLPVSDEEVLELMAKYGRE